MDFINEIIDMFKNLSLKNIVDIGIGLAIIVIFKIFSPLLAYIIVKMFKFKEKDKKKIKENGFYNPLKIFFVLLGVYVGAMALKLPANVFSIITKIFKICIIILIAKGFSNLFNSNSETFSNIRKKLHINGTDATINFVSKIAKSLIYIVAGFIVIAELGYDLSGLITGLGIGSVVIALAAQDVAKNFLSGLAIISDRPFDIDDYIEVDKYAGTVEDITFRTTRIRDINNKVTILPNSLLTTTPIVNGTKIEKRRYDALITLELNTPLEKVSSLESNIRTTLTNNTHILPENIRIFFDKISADGIDLSISCYTDIINYEEFLKFKEDMNYFLLQMINQSGVELAYPSQSVYLKKD